MRTLITKLRWLLQRRRREAELRAELDFHLEEEAADARDRGASERQARLAARHDLGNRAVIEEDARAAWGWMSIERAGQDLGYALRLLRRRPVLSATAILTLMLGIGGTTAVFSIGDSLLVRQLPVDQPGELVRLVENRRDGSVAESFTLASYEQLQRTSQSFTDLIASSEQFPRPGEIQIDDSIRQAFVQLVSTNYFDALGIRAARGQVFHAPEPSPTAAPVAVISDDYWRREYRGAANAIGSRFRRSNREFTIVGITPPGFRGTQIDVPTDIWLSIDQVVPANAPDRTRGRWMQIMGRLRPGVSRVQATTEASASVGRAVWFDRGDTGYSALRFKLYRPLQLVSLVVVLVLFIAAANLANLMRAATVARQREIAVRAAIGASRSRILRQLVTESVVLSVIGGALGLFVAYWTANALLAFLPPDQAVALPNLGFRLDVRVIGFATLLAFLTCGLFGVIPALRAAGSASPVSLRSGQGTGHRTRSAFSRSLQIAQVVMCTALLLVSSAFVRTLQKLRGQDAGYQEAQLLVADVGFPRSYAENRRDELVEQLRARASALPDVTAVAFSHLGQLSGSAIEMRIGFPSADMTEPELTNIIEQRVSPDFLRAMGTRLAAGREFAETDDDRAPLVAIVNESFVRRFLPGRDPIGASFFRDGGTHSREPMEIVGVVRDSKWVNLRDDAPVMYYRPYKQVGGTPMVRLVVRTSGDPRDLTRDLLPLARAIDKDMMLSNVVPFSDVVDRTLVVERLIANVSSAFGGLALLIACIGLYGALAYNVARRRREIGLRIAVGAGRGSIEGMFLKESLMLLAVGAAIGIPAGIAMTRLASYLLYGLGPADPVSLAISLSVLTATVVAATFLPARRAARIDPILALRDE